MGDARSPFSFVAIKDANFPFSIFHLPVLEQAALNFRSIKLVKSLKVGKGGLPRRKGRGHPTLELNIRQYRTERGSAGC